MDQLIHQGPDGFGAFSLRPEIIDGIARCRFGAPTDIQAAAIGPIQQGRDVFGLAQTGTGKTAAYVIPMLDRLCQAQAQHVRALIIAPVRELARQVLGEIRQLAGETQLSAAAVYGEIPRFRLISSLRRQPDIVVGCPGRLVEILKDPSHPVDLSKLEMLVIDEVDELLKQGFLDDLREIVEFAPRRGQRQTLLFSATMHDDLSVLVDELLHDPDRIEVRYKDPLSTITHVVCAVERPDKISALTHILTTIEHGPVIVFSDTKRLANIIVDRLQAAGVRAEVMHADLSQRDREDRVAGFRSGRFDVIVASDVLARGISFDGVTHVINFDAPCSANKYTHRVGRTGRMNQHGIALTFAMPYQIRNFRTMTQGLGVQARLLEVGDLRELRVDPARGVASLPPVAETPASAALPPLLESPATTLEEGLGYTFRRSDLLPVWRGETYAARTDLYSPARLHYIGSAALNLALTEVVTEKSRRCHYRNDLAGLIFSATDTENLWRIARSLGVIDEAELSRRDMNATQQTGLMINRMYGLIGAVYHDSGGVGVRPVAERLFGGQLENNGIHLGAATFVVKGVQPLDEAVRERYQRVLGHTFSNPAFLDRAFLHLYEKVNPWGWDQRLSMLGHAVVQLVASEYLLRELPQASDFELRDCRRDLLQLPFLSSSDPAVALCEHLRTRTDEEGNSIGIAAIVYKKAVGALYLDGGIAAASQYLLRCLPQHVAPAAAAPAFVRSSPPAARVNSGQTSPRPVQPVIRQVPPTVASPAPVVAPQSAPLAPEPAPTLPRSTAPASAAAPMRAAERPPAAPPPKATAALAPQVDATSGAAPTRKALRVVEPPTAPKETDYKSYLAAVLTVARAPLPKYKSARDGSGFRTELRLAKKHTFHGTGETQIEAEQVAARDAAEAYDRGRLRLG